MVLIVEKGPSPASFVSVPVVQPQSCGGPRLDTSTGCTAWPNAPQSRGIYSQSTCGTRSPAFNRSGNRYADVHVQVVVSPRQLDVGELGIGQELFTYKARHACEKPHGRFTDFAGYVAAVAVPLVARSWACHPGGLLLCHVAFEGDLC